MPNIAIVGEAWGDTEEYFRIPFQGSVGHCLDNMLKAAGINRADCHLTTVFKFKPPGGDIDNMCGKAGEVKNKLPHLAQGKYIKDEYLGSIEELHEELLQVKPNVIVAAGATAPWALTGSGAIKKTRGTVMACPVQGLGKLIPTYNPAAILRQWELRLFAIMDLKKALRESFFPDIRRPHRQIFIEPTLDDMEWFYRTHIQDAKQLSFDIETDPANGQITCIGFAPSEKVALVVPFCKGKTIASGSYWKTAAEELQAIAFVRKVLDHPSAKVGQNGIYDISWLWTKLGIPIRNYADDTMLLHHALYPEAEKSLGFLGSLYTNEASWKLMGRGAKKGDDE